MNILVITETRGAVATIRLPIRHFPTGSPSCICYVSSERGVSYVFSLLQCVVFYDYDSNGEVSTGDEIVPIYYDPSAKGTWSIIPMPQPQPIPQESCR